MTLEVPDLHAVGVHPRLAPRGGGALWELDGEGGATGAESRWFWRLSFPESGTQKGAHDIPFFRRDPHLAQFLPLYPPGRDKKRM